MPDAHRRGRHRQRHAGDDHAGVATARRHDNYADGEGWRRHCRRQVHAVGHDGDVLSGRGRDGRFFDTEIADRESETAAAPDDSYSSSRTARPSRGPLTTSDVADDSEATLTGLERHCVFDGGVFDLRPAARRRAHDAVGRDGVRRAHGEGDGRRGTNWYFAEGSQGFFSTYLLLANPQPSANIAPSRTCARTRRRWCAITRWRRSRTTIDAGADAEL